MLRALTSLLAVSTFPGLAAERASLTVQLYDLAGAGPVIERAIERTTFIFERAGVRLQWRRHPAPAIPWGVDNPFIPERTPTDLIVRLLPKEPADRLARRRSIAGIAYPAARGDFRHMATLFFDRVADVAEANRSPLGVILGNLIGHELGHLLLGPGAHSLAGLMRCPWDVAEFRAAERGELLFSPQQAQIIRAEVVKRIRAAAAQPSLAVAAR